VVQRLIPGDTHNHKDEQAGRVMMNRIGVEDALECAGMQLVAAHAASSPPPARVP
jgi:hypothetical protein